MKRKPYLDAALLDLLEYIDEGCEYPEAHWHVVYLHDLTVREGEILTDMYDEYCGEGLK